MHGQRLTIMLPNIMTRLIFQTKKTKKAAMNTTAVNFKNYLVQSWKPIAFTISMVTNLPFFWLLLLFVSNLISASIFFLTFAILEIPEIFQSIKHELLFFFTSLSFFFFIINIFFKFIHQTDTLGLHRVENPSHSDGAVSLHLYCPPYNTCSIFNQKTGKQSKCTVKFYSKYGQRRFKVSNWHYK